MANDKKNDKKVKKEKKHFFKDFRSELKKVTWPTKKQVINNTVAVLTIVFITAAIVFVLDLGFECLNKYGINKIKSAVKKDNQTETVVEATATPENGTEQTAEGNNDNNEKVVEESANQSTTENVEAQATAEASAQQ